MIKSNLKPRTQHLNQTGSSLNDARGTNEKNLAVKESVKRTLNEIEDNFKMFKYLPNQKLHPFDLTAEELAEMKYYFPEFYPKNIALKH